MQIIKVNIHKIKRTQIDRRALQVVELLQARGFEAYVVGGAIRDLLMGKQPKDFDIATSAKPEEVRRLFRNCRLIGKRFRLAHIVFGRDIFEVATFRGNPVNPQMDNLGRILYDNSYGTLADDAFRRDFTINSFYYNPATEEIIDFHNAFEDLRGRILRLIGDPELRYSEDPVRMLRAARFQAKLNMRFEKFTWEEIKNSKNLLKNVPQARLLDECEKLFLNSNAVKTFEILNKLGLFEILFPDAARIINRGDKFGKYAERLIIAALTSTERRIAMQKTTTIAFVFAAIFWAAYQLQYQALFKQGKIWKEAMYEAVNLVCLAALERISVPARLREMIREIWEIQADFERFNNNHKRRILVANKARFRAGFDFLLIRTEAGEKLEKLINKWIKEYGV